MGSEWEGVEDKEGREGDQDAARDAWRFRCSRCCAYLRERGVASTDSSIDRYPSLSYTAASSPFKVSPPASQSHSVRRLPCLALLSSSSLGRKPANRKPDTSRRQQHSQSVADVFLRRYSCLETCIWPHQLISYPPCRRPCRVALLRFIFSLSLSPARAGQQPDYPVAQTGRPVMRCFGPVVPVCAIWFGLVWASFFPVALCSLAKAFGNKESSALLFFLYLFFVGGAFGDC